MNKGGKGTEISSSMRRLICADLSLTSLRHSHRPTPPSRCPSRSSLPRRPRCLNSERPCENVSPNGPRQTCSSSAPDTPLPEKISKEQCENYSAPRVVADLATQENESSQAPSPAPCLIPAESENQPRTHIAIGTANGGTSADCLSR